MQSSRMTTRISPTYEWRPLLPHEEFRHGECWHNDKPGDEEGEETEVPLGYLVEFAFLNVGEEAEGNRRKRMFMRHQWERHGTYPIRHHCHKDMLKALREQMDVSPDFVFPYVTYGYIETPPPEQELDMLADAMQGNSDSEP